MMQIFAAIMMIMLFVLTCYAMAIDDVQRSSHAVRPKVSADIKPGSPHPPLPPRKRDVE